MSLTKDDLNSIKDIVEDAKEDVKIHVAAGFAEVHKRIDGVEVGLKEVKDTVSRIENIQRTEISRADQHSKAITKLKKQLA